MQIRTQFTLIFALVVGIILFFFSFSIYFLSQEFIQNDFHIRLEDKAVTTLKLLLVTSEDNDNLLFDYADEKELHSFVDYNTVIYNEKEHLIYHDSTAKIPTKEVLNLIKEKKVHTYSENGIEHYGFLYSYKENTYLLIASAHDQYGTKYISNLKRILIVRGSIIAVIIFISGWLYAGRFLKPITKIVRQVDKITSSSLNHRLSAENKNDEIGQLTNTFNNMLERIETSFKIQKRFVSNASHELRNPLTAISGQIEVSLMKDRENEEYKSVLTAILKDIKNLRILSNNLLELANSDVETMLLHFEKIRIDETLWNVRNELLKQKPEYKIYINFDTEIDNESSLTCKGEEKLLKTVFINIIDNACKFSTSKTVEIKVTFEKSNIILFFIDHGIGIPENHLKHIFEPFFRGSNAQGIPGNGIGLSLVQRIIKLHNGKIFIRSKFNEGTTVEVVLPNLS